jgi:hypothetical protein
MAALAATAAPYLVFYFGLSPSRFGDSSSSTTELPAGAARTLFERGGVVSMRRGPTLLVPCGRGLAFVAKSDKAATRVVQLLTYAFQASAPDRYFALYRATPGEREVWNPHFVAATLPPHARAVSRANPAWARALCAGKSDAHFAPEGCPTCSLVQWVYCG